MNNSGSFVLFAAGITTALTAQAQTPIDELEGMLSASIVARFAYGGSGGTSVSALVQTSFDGGTIFFDVARLDFATSSGTRYVNLSGLTAKGATAYAALSAEGVNDGLLGPMFRAVITSVGTYVSGTLLDLRMVAR
jgi:hypothetical protein